MMHIPMMPMMPICLSTGIEDSPQMSALRGEVYALETQIERLKKELQVSIAISKPLIIKWG